MLHSMVPKVMCGTSVTSDHEVSLDSLHQGQGVDLHWAPLPLFHISAIWVSLKLTLQLVSVEELKCLRAPVEKHKNTKNHEHTLNGCETHTNTHR